MNIKNSEKVTKLLRQRANVGNLLQLLDDYSDCSVIISAKADDSKGRFVFLDKEGIDEAVGLLLSMQDRIEGELKEL